MNLENHKEWLRDSYVRRLEESNDFIHALLYEAIVRIDMGIDPNMVEDFVIDIEKIFYSEKYNDIGWSTCWTKPY